MAFVNSFLFTVLLVAILAPTTIYIFNFFDVPFQSYGNYLLFAIALAVFNTLMPYDTKSLFDNIK